MEKNKILKVQSLLNDCTKDEAHAIISQIEDTEILYVYLYNYNWDNGFEIPQSIIDNNNCDLSIALLMFYRADGVSYLMDKFCDKNLPHWYSFVKNLYNSILNRKYQSGNIEFKIPLSKVQLYKLKKMLTEKEKIFIENIEGENLCISL